LAAILLFVLLAFGVIFVAFHNVFFPPGTWTFLYSDTLIRLFPERFWRDTFIAVGVVAAVPGWRSSISSSQNKKIHAVCGRCMDSVMLLFPRILIRIGLLTSPFPSITSSWNE